MATRKKPLRLRIGREIGRGRPATRQALMSRVQRDELMMLVKGVEELLATVREIEEITRTPGAVKVMTENDLEDRFLMTGHRMDEVIVKATHYKACLMCITRLRALQDQQEVEVE